MLSADVLRLLRVPPLRGRIFLDDDDRPGAAPVVLLGERLWQRRYGGDPAIVGRHIMIDGDVSRGHRRAARRFSFSVDGDGALAAAWPEPGEGRAGELQLFGRRRDLTPNVIQSPRLREELTRILPRVVTEFPSQLTMSMLEQVHLRPVVTPLRDVDRWATSGACSGWCSARLASCC